jgi:hypothetical protein
MRDLGLAVVQILPFLVKGRVGVQEVVDDLGHHLGVVHLEVVPQLILVDQRLQETRGVVHWLKFLLFADEIRLMDEERSVYSSPGQLGLFFLG